MYQPAHFIETRRELMHALMDAHPFATLVTLGVEGLNANHLPFELDPGSGEHGCLRAHVARSNPVWQDLRDGVEALVIFQGPHAYVSPGWYPTKQAHGRAVPTWNYVVVHAYGPLRVVEDKAWLRAMVKRLSVRHEAAMAQPWRLEDAPADYIDRMLDAIVGIELPIARLLGKWKVSQNQPRENREGVVRGLRELGGNEGLPIAELIEQHGNRAD